MARFRSEKTRVARRATRLDTDDGDSLQAKVGHDEGEVNQLRDSVIKELESMRDTASISGRNRLDMAIEVAKVRMANPPDFPGIKELMQIFPNIKKTSMFNILQDIQQALLRVAQKQGLEGLEANIRRRTG